MFLFFSNLEKTYINFVISYQKPPFQVKIDIFGSSQNLQFYSTNNLKAYWAFYQVVLCRSSLPSSHVSSPTGFSLGQLVLSEGISIYQAYQSLLMTGSTRQTDHIRQPVIWQPSKRIRPLPTVRSRHWCTTAGTRRTGVNICPAKTSAIYRGQTTHHKIAIQRTEPPRLGRSNRQAPAVLICFQQPVTGQTDSKS